MSRRARRSSGGGRKGPTPRTRRPEVEEARPQARANPFEERRYRQRPTWHRAVGWLSITVGIAIVVVNYIDYADLRLLPGGHQEWYFFAGLLVAASGTWWLGFFDRRR